MAEGHVDERGRHRGGEQESGGRTQEVSKAEAWCIGYQATAGRAAGEKNSSLSFSLLGLTPLAVACGAVAMVVVVVIRLPLCCTDAIRVGPFPSICDIPRSIYIYIYIYEV